MAMLEGEQALTLEQLSEATQAWVEQEYHRTVHTELKATPLAPKRSANPIFPANSEPANLVSIATTKGAKWKWIGNGWSGAWSRGWPIGRRA